MPIPKTRQELLEQISNTYLPLKAELDDGDCNLGDVVCVDSWTVKDLMAVRLWWTRSVLDWIDAGRAGRVPTVPAEGFGWNETPRLNAEIVEMAQHDRLTTVTEALHRQYKRLLETIDALTDDELLKVGMFEWAGKYPVCRWLSINTVRQYKTARTHIRRAKRQ